MWICPDLDMSRLKICVSIPVPVVYHRLLVVQCYDKPSTFLFIILLYIIHISIRYVVQDDLPIEHGLALCWLCRVMRFEASALALIMINLKTSFPLLVFHFEYLTTMIFYTIHSIHYSY